MKFFVRFTKDPEKYSIIDKQNLPKALEFCKQFRPDCLLSRMDQLTISPNTFLQLKAQYRIEDIAIKSVYHLMYKHEGKEAFKGIECCRFELEREANKAFGEKHGKIFEIANSLILSKRMMGKNIPICIIIDKGPKKIVPQIV